jgi:hypothetical protein
VRVQDGAEMSCNMNSQPGPDNKYDAFLYFKVLSPFRNYCRDLILNLNYKTTIKLCNGGSK